MQLSTLQNFLQCVITQTNGQFGHRQSQCAFINFPADSVEEGEKVVKTAIDNFGRLGTYSNFHTIPGLHLLDSGRASAFAKVPALIRTYCTVVDIAWFLCCSLSHTHTHMQT